MIHYLFAVICLVNLAPINLVASSVIVAQPGAKSNKHMLAVISPEDPKNIEIVPSGMSWLKSLHEPISFVFQFRAGEENDLDEKNYGLISETTNIAELDSAGFRVEKVYVNFNSNDQMRTWKLYAIAALLSSSYKIESGDHFKGAPKAMQIFNMLRQALLLGGELNRTKTIDLNTLRFPSIYWVDEQANELRYLTSTQTQSLVSTKLAIDLPEYFDSKADELSMLSAKGALFRLARPKKLAGEPMTGDQVAELIKFLVRYLNSDRYPNQLEAAFMNQYKHNYCRLGFDEKFADRLSQLNEQLESPAITEFREPSERVRQQIERLMCPKFDANAWCQSPATTV